MPATSLGSFIELLRGAVAERAAQDPALYVAGSATVSIADDKLVVNGSADSVEAGLIIKWRSACQGKFCWGEVGSKIGYMLCSCQSYNCSSLYLTSQINYC